MAKSPDKEFPLGSGLAERARKAIKDRRRRLEEAEAKALDKVAPLKVTDPKSKN